MSDSANGFLSEIVQDYTFGYWCCQKSKMSKVLKNDVYQFAGFTEKSALVNISENLLYTVKKHFSFILCPRIALTRIHQFSNYPLFLVAHTCTWSPNTMP